MIFLEFLQQSNNNASKTRTKSRILRMFTRNKFSVGEILLNTLVHKLKQVSFSSFLLKRFLIVGELRHPLGNPSSGRGE